ncbi:hypothetical protein DMO16_18990 [Fictibacillus sp. S7]|nr:hypothetical protein DMO16_18990 [Fictibacillus sp. S7]
MRWRIRIVSSKLLGGIPIIVTIFVLLSFYTDSVLIFFAGMVLISLYFFAKYYTKHVPTALVLENNKHTIRLFPDEQDSFSFLLRNTGTIPIHHAKLDYFFNDVIRLWDENHNTPQIHLLPNQAAEITVPFTSMKRGVSRIKDITVQMKDLVGLNTIHLTFDTIYHTEVVVYPNPTKIVGIEHIEKMTLGEYPLSSSLFEDTSQPFGSRDYVSGDSFNRIHWKLSSKMDVLQTKVFEKTTMVSWSFILNLGEIKTTLSKQSIEQNISYLAYLCQYATSKNIPYEMFINVQIPGKHSAFHLDVSKGKEHLGRTMEILARLDHSSIKVPNKRFLLSIDARLAPSTTLFYFGEKDQLSERHFVNWRKNGSRIYLAEKQDIEDGAYLRSWRRANENDMVAGR